jgi:hypothetical protein
VTVARAGIAMTEAPAKAATVPSVMSSTSRRF